MTWEQTGTNTPIYYLYDADGELWGIKYNNNTYFYVKNAQGDIIKLVDTSGNTAASYKYDAWGKLMASTSEVAGLANANPYRYRGYRYDNETGLYYLQSRYYNPEWGRFINTDILAGKVGGLLSHNTFIYGLNNPTNMSDPSGHWSIWDTLLAVVVVVAVVATVAICIVQPELIPAAIAGVAALAPEIEEEAPIVEEELAGGAEETSALAENIGSDATTIETEVIGQAHGSPIHQDEINEKVAELKALNYEKIYINKSLNTAGLSGSQRPDIIAIKEKQLDIFEFASKSQVSKAGLSALRDKLDEMTSQNPGSIGHLFVPHGLIK